jgi:3-dehydroquinate dehydratase/shikimate dehydrogenase
MGPIPEPKDGTARRATMVATVAEPAALEPRALAALAGRADWLELRADRVGDVPAERLRAAFPGRLLYTLRSRAEGGAFAGPREARRRRIAAASAGFDLVDLEAERDLARDLLDAVEPERRVVSWHGPAGDLASLRSRWQHLRTTPAALYKLVPRAAHSGEELAPLVLLAELERADVVCFAGGEAGFWTRLVAPRLGAPIVYASATELPAAPGMLPLAALERDYALPALPPVRALAGVAGFPALGSLSPRLHNAAYRALGLPMLFVPFEVEHFGDFWLEIVEPETLGRLGLPLLGLAVTAPHKEVAFTVAGATSPLANRLQAVNTLVRRDGVWEGESTDSEGVLGTLARRGVAAAGRRAAVLGCGGAGRAAALGLARAGAQVALVNRGQERGLAAARQLGLPFVPWSELDLARFDLVVHATPLGRGDGAAPPLEVSRLAAGTVVVDLVYGERPTALVEAARGRGLVAVDGREVLLTQAIPQFRAMTGRELPLELAAAALGIDATVPGGRP